MSVKVNNSFVQLNIKDFVITLNTDMTANLNWKVGKMTSNSIVFS